MKTIKFNRQTDYRGRNGWGKQTGIEVRKTMLSNTIVINPTNTMGATDACVIEIPRESLQAVVNALTHFYNEDQRKAYLK